MEKLSLKLYAVTSSGVLHHMNAEFMPTAEIISVLIIQGGCDE
jgi:hypothetical protein